MSHYNNFGLQRHMTFDVAAPKLNHYPLLARPYHALFELGTCVPPCGLHSQSKWAAAIASTKMEEVTTRAVHPWPYSHVRSHRKETPDPSQDRPHMASSCPGRCCGALSWELFGTPDYWALAPVCRCGDGSFCLSLVLGEKPLSRGHDVFDFLLEADPQPPVGIIDLLMFLLCLFS